MTKNQLTGLTLNPNASIAADFAKPLLAAIEQMCRETKRELKKAFEENPGFAQDASISSQSRIVVNMLLGKWEPRFNRLAKKLVKRMIARTVRYSAVSVKSALKPILPDLSIDTTEVDERLRDVIKAATEEAASLIKLIPTKYLSEVQGQVARSITTGDGLKSLVPFLNEKYEGNIRHARNVALDQTRKAYTSVNTERLKKAGIKQFRWAHTGGSAHPRKDHVEMDGNVYELANPPKIGRMYGKDVYGLPAQLPYCHPASSSVKLSVGINKLYRRRYTGKLSRIITDDGAVLEATCNHPVLTQRGWIAANDVQSGDYVFKGLEHGLSALSADVQADKASIGDLFDAAAARFGNCSTIRGGSDLEFHGDVSDDKIDIVDIDGLLPLELNAEVCKVVCEFILAWADVSVKDFATLSPASIDLCLVRVFAPASSGASRIATLATLLASKRGKADDIGFRLAAYARSVLDEAASNRGSANTVSARELQFAHAMRVLGYDLSVGKFYALFLRSVSLGDVESPCAQELGEVVGVDADGIGRLPESLAGAYQACRVKENIIVEFSDHVYSLESKGGWYIADNTVVHNCRCRMIPVLDLD